MKTSTASSLSSDLNYRQLDALVEIVSDARDQGLDALDTELSLERANISRDNVMTAAQFLFERIALLEESNDAKNQKKLLIDLLCQHEDLQQAALDCLKDPPYSHAMVEVLAKCIADAACTDQHFGKNLLNRLATFQTEIRMFFELRERVLPGSEFEKFIISYLDKNGTSQERHAALCLIGDKCSTLALMQSLLRVAKDSKCPIRDRELAIKCLKQYRHMPYVQTSLAELIINESSPLKVAEAAGSVLNSAHHLIENVQKSLAEKALNGHDKISVLALYALSGKFNNSAALINVAVNFAKDNQLKVDYRLCALKALTGNPLSLPNVQQEIVALLNDTKCRISVLEFLGEVRGSYKQERTLRAKLLGTVAGDSLTQALCAVRAIDFSLGLNRNEKELLATLREKDRAEVGAEIVKHSIIVRMGQCLRDTPSLVSEFLKFTECEGLARVDKIAALATLKELKGRALEEIYIALHDPNSAIVEAAIYVGAARLPEFLKYPKLAKRLVSTLIRHEPKTSFDSVCEAFQRVTQGKAQLRRIIINESVAKDLDHRARTRAAMLLLVIEHADRSGNRIAI